MSEPVRRRSRSAVKKAVSNDAPKRRASTATYAKSDYDGNPGRAPSFLKPAVVTRLCQALLSGNTIENACRMAGIDSSTYYRYRDEAKKAEVGSPLAQFMEKVNEALSQAEHRNVLVIQTAAKKHWQAAAWFLERRNPREWARRDRIGIGGENEGDPILLGNVNGDELSKPQAVAALKAAIVRAERRTEQHQEA